MPHKKRVTREYETRGRGIRRTFRLYADEWDLLAGIADMRFNGNEHAGIRRALVLLDLVYGVDVELAPEIAVLELNATVTDADKAKAAVLAAAERVKAEADG